jgi:hypothetical protein
MKKFLLTLGFLILLMALGILGWSNTEQRRKLNELRSEVQQLELQRRDLQRQVSTTQRDPKPEEQVETRKLIEEQASHQRGLLYKSPVQYKMIERSQLREVLVEKAQEQYSAQEMRDYSRCLAAFGLISENTDLLKLLLSVYGEQVAAFYVPEEHVLYTFKDQMWTSGLDKMILAHELTHALQDQNFDLQKFPLNIKTNDDLALATSALIEGDATIAGLWVYGENLEIGSMFKDLGTMLGQDTRQLLAAPPFVQEMVKFPYQAGAQFALALYMSGGNDALDAAFRNPPTCTKDILHPEKFLQQHASPERVDFPRLESKDWRLIGNNALGEFGMRFVLQQGIGAFDAQMLAQGWNGDRYQVYEHGTNGPTGLVWATAWESEPQAAEFEEAYRKAVEKRVGSVAATLHIHRDGRHVTVVQSPDATFLDLWGTSHAAHKAN